MYKLLIKLTRFIASILRIIQVLGILYVVLHIIYWFMQLGQARSAYSFAEYFSYMQPATDIIIQNVPALTGSEFALFHIETVINIILDVLVIVIYNFIFFITDYIEEIFIARGYQVGELADTDLSFNKKMS